MPNPDDDGRWRLSLFFKIKNNKLESLLKALIEGDVALFEEILQDVVTSVFSYHDFDGQPEWVYHALVTGW